MPNSYFEEPPVQESAINFTDMNISRPILKVIYPLLFTLTVPSLSHSFPLTSSPLPPLSLLSLLPFQAVTSLGYVTPTPVQASTVPVALLGKDICACAATGTGNHYIHPLHKRDTEPFTPPRATPHGGFCIPLAFHTFGKDALPLTPSPCNQKISFTSFSATCGLAS